MRDKNLLKEDGFAVSTEVAFGDPADQIIAYSKQHNIELIAMATHGHPWSYRRASFAYGQRRGEGVDPRYHTGAVAATF